VRRLCDQCKQAYQPTPQLLQRLGLPADRVKTLYQPFIPPPPEQRVDAKGNPIEIEICKKCAGRGYYGRMGIYEVLKLNDTIRKAALQNPSPEAVRQIAKKEGHKSFQEEGLLAAVVGHTSLQELQRILTPPAKPGGR
jgi:type II secretory ATPase GspE/PulE/Tfp pilus assembly ATPase PilB-like protein